MAKKPLLKPSLAKQTNGVIALLKRNPIASAGALLTLIAGVPGAIAGIIYMRDGSEPFWYATHDWVREHTQQVVGPLVTAQVDTRKILRDLQIDTANRSKRDEDNNLAKWTFERDKITDPLTLELIDRQVKASKDSIEALDNQIKILRELRDKGK